MPTQLTTKEVAALAGLRPGTIRAYRKRGTIPEPDGYVGTTPWWKTTTVRAWLKTRPGRGRPRGPQKEPEKEPPDCEELA